MTNLDKDGLTGKVVHHHRGVSFTFAAGVLGDSGAICTSKSK